MRILRLLFRKWWVVALQGLLLIILSLYIFQNPVAVLAGISFWFGVVVLATGLLGVVSWLVADTSERSALSLVWSIVTAVFGLLVLGNMFATMKAITVIFGLWMLLTGLQLAHSGWSLRSRSALGWVMLSAGVLTAATAVTMIFNVRAGAVGIGTLFGLQVMLAGIALVLLSFAKKVLAEKLAAKRATLNTGGLR
jgi:uncharacterized membrane protein HdeD (DUF308 family)